VPRSLHGFNDISNKPTDSTFRAEEEEEEEEETSTNLHGVTSHNMLSHNQHRKYFKNPNADFIWLTRKLKIKQKNWTKLNTTLAYKIS
jgi:hypothetical protein